MVCVCSTQMKTVIPLFQVTSENDVKNALQTTQDKFGRLDVAVNCAGTASASRIYNFKKKQPFDLKVFQKTIEVYNKLNIYSSITYYLPIC